MPVYLYWGEEEFNLNKTVSDLKGKILDQNWILLNHKVLNEPEVTLLAETLQTIPMTFGNMLFEIHAPNLFLRGSKKASSSDSAMKKLIDILEHLNDNTNNIHVLFICPIPRDTGRKVDSVLKLTKTIEKIGEVKEFPAFKFYQEKELVNWITKNAISKNVKISNDAALILFHNTGSDLRHLDSELDKLKLSVYPEKIITKENVLALSATHENIFTLIDFWIQNNKSKALMELHKLFEKDHSLKIIATLQTTIRRLLKIKLESKTKNAFEISKIVKQHQFVVEKDLQKLKNISEERLLDMKEKLTQAEYKIKSGELDPELSLEMVILNSN